MTTTTEIDIDRVEYRRALEALRNGVPNRDAVRVLGCGQVEAERRFEEQLGAVPATFTDGGQAPGTLVSGGFGTGKSHLLEYLQHVALSASFVCSRVVISKETPLHDQAKVFRAAVDNAVLPDRTGEAVKELGLKLHQGSASFRAFEQWAMHDDCGVSQLFPASLALYQQLGNDPDLVEAVTNFWAGENLPIAEVRRGLKQCGLSAAYPVKAVPARQLPHERFTFLSRMIQGAGYRGWVLLIDEVELIGRYSLLQRGKSYAELARWLGLVEGVAYPGLTAVAAITDDFDINVLAEKGDLDYVGARLREKGTEEMAILAARAEAGMRAIQRDAVPLEPPTESGLRETYQRVREVHGGAYGWDPPDVEGAEVAIRRAMRSYVRRWINVWDLKRLYPDAEVHTIEEELAPSYGEDQDLEVGSDAAPDDVGDVVDFP